MACSAFAAQAQFVRPPDAGQLLQTVPPAPSAPRSSEPALEVQQPRPVAPDAPAGLRFKVSRLRITGASVYSEAELLALVREGIDREVSLAELEALAARITRFYRDNGYLVARAYLPAQEIRDGEAEIAVIEGRYGRIEMRNGEGLKFSTALGGVKEGDVVTAAPLERSLLLLSDTPGIEVKSTLTPGASVGTSDLIVDLSPGRPVTGSVTFDNYGSSFSGAYRLGGTLNLNNPGGAGDLFTLRVLTSGEDFKYGRLAYQRPVNAAGTNVGVAYSAMEYRLGEEFAALDARGNAQIGSLFATHPFIRSRSANLNGQLGYDDKSTQDRLNAFGTTTDKKIGVSYAGLTGDMRDALLGGGSTVLSATYSAGRLEITSPVAQAIDSVTARTEGRYGKIAFSALRLQNLAQGLSLYLAYSGQRASKNLDSTEKVALGGISGVRAYPQGEAMSDQSDLATVELRWDVAAALQLTAFVDSGRGTLNKQPWPAAADANNLRELSGIGFGVNWKPEGGWLLQAGYAAKLSSSPATADSDRSGRFWLQLMKAL